ncbi:MAG: DNRLRE domain-containing protein [Acidobacteria bacterium]|nr:DNRLRE domain-containing protein [Acidobacteriota bacterium]
MLCGTGGYYDAPGGSYCEYTVHTVVFYGTIEQTYPFGTTLYVGNLFSFTTSSIDCYVFEVTGGDPQEGATESALAGDGPIVFVRSRYPEGASGQVPLSGVARDDVYGISALNFWVDNQLASVSNVQTGLFDPYLCGEVPDPGCNPNSRFEATLDVSGLPDGMHTLQVFATNGRSVDPIPTYYELEFEVANGAGGCTDTTPPAVNFSAPAQGALLEGTATVSFTASDSSGIESVGLYVDGTWVEDDTEAPYTFQLDTTQYPDGPLELKGKAEDGCGNVKFSNPRNVTVANGPEVSLTFAPTDDTFSHQDNPDSVYGAYNFFRLRTVDGGHGRHGYLRFAVSGVVGPVVSAKLRLRTQETAFTTHSVGVYKLIETPWTEETLTWNNAPLNWVQWVETAPPLAADSWHELDLSALVTGNGVYSFGMATGANQGGLDFWSKESIYPPELVVISVPSAAPGASGD